MSLRQDIIRTVWKAIWGGLEVGYLGNPITEATPVTVTGSPNKVWVARQVGGREGFYQALNPFGVRTDRLYLPVRILTLEDDQTKIVACVDPFYNESYSADLNLLRNNLDVNNGHNIADLMRYGMTSLYLNTHSEATNYDDAESIQSGIGRYDISVSLHWDAMARIGARRVTDDANNVENDQATTNPPLGWTEFDIDGVLTPAFSATTRTLDFNPTPDTTNPAYCGIYKAWPTFSNGALFWTDAHISSDTDEQRAGIAIFENATSSTGDMRVLSLGRNADAGILQIMAESLTAYNVAPTVNASQEWHLPMAFLRFRYTSSGTVLYYDYSIDGLGWQTFHSETLSFTPQHWGIVVNKKKGAFARFSFIRTSDGSAYEVYQPGAGQIRYH